MGGEEKKISSGDVFLIPPDIAHDYVNARALHIYNILFSDGLFQQFGEDFAQLPNYQLYFNLSNLTKISTIENNRGTSYMKDLKIKPL